MKSWCVAVILLVFTVYTGAGVWADSIIVKSPNGGGLYASGASTTITWTTTGNIRCVRIQLTKDNGITWEQVTAGISNTGSYSWTVPNVTSDSCRIMVADTASGGAMDASDSVFRIIQLRRITVKSPNGGESLPVGTKQKMTWSTIGLIDSVQVALSCDNGSSWILFTSATPNTGAFSFFVPDLPADRCRIKISSSADTAVWDICDSAFAIYNPNDPIVSQYGIPKFSAISLIATNPAGSMLAFNLRLTVRESVTVEIYSLKGYLFKRLVDETYNAGYHTIVWNCDDYAGQPAPNGLYCIRVRLGEKAYSEIVTRLK